MTGKLLKATLVVFLFVATYFLVHLALALM